MIRNQAERTTAAKRLVELTSKVAAERTVWQERGHVEPQLSLLVAPLQAMCDAMADEIAEFDNAIQGNVEPVVDLADLGRSLILLRIAAGITQRELARRLGVVESQVSRDEKHEYFGATLTRMATVLNALGATAQVDLRRVPGGTTEARA